MGNNGVGPRNQDGAAGFSAAEHARLDTFMPELAAQVHGDGRQEASGDFRFGSADHLVIHSNAFWHDFKADTGGHGVLSLLAHLHGGVEAGVHVARAWLAQHAGDGRLGRADGTEEDDIEQPLIDAEAEAFIDALWWRAGQVTSIPAAMKYFGEVRQVDIVATGAVTQWRALDNWRGDETGVLAAITGNAGELVAIQILHITPNGEKSTVRPVRKIIRGP